MAERPKIGELLVAAGVIDAATLEAALAKQRTKGGRLGKILLAMGALEEELLVRTVARQLDMPVAWLRGKQVKAEVLTRLPGHLARKHRCLPVMVDRKGPETLLVAMEDPSDTAALDEVAVAAGCPVRVVLAAPTELDEAIERHYPDPRAPQVSLDRLEREAVRDPDPESDAAHDDEPAASEAEPDLGSDSDDDAENEDDEEPELLLTDSLNESGSQAFGVPDSEPPPAEPEPAPEPGAAAGVQDDLAGGFEVDNASGLDLGAPGSSVPPAESDADLGLDLGPDPGPSPETEPPRGSARYAGDSLDDAIDLVRGAGFDADEHSTDENENTDIGESLFPDDPLEATSGQAGRTMPPRAIEPEEAAKLPEDTLPRDPELRAVVMLLIERGLLDPLELALRLRRSRGGSSES